MRIRTSLLVVLAYGCLAGAILGVLLANRGIENAEKAVPFFVVIGVAIVMILYARQWAAGVRDRQHTDTESSDR